jgi:hypothetical protein
VGHVGSGAAFLKKRRFRTLEKKWLVEDASSKASLKLCFRLLRFLSQNAGMGGSRGCADLEPLGTAVAQRESDLLEALACQVPGLMVSTKRSPRGKLAHSPTIGPPMAISDAHQIML